MEKLIKNSYLLLGLILVLNGYSFGQTKEFIYSSEHGFNVQRIKDPKCTYVLATIDTTLMKAQLVGYDRKNVSGQSAQRIINQPDTKIVLGSGFVKSYYPLFPLGFLKTYNEVINPVIKSSYDGVIAFSEKGSIDIFLISDQKKLAKCYGGFQVGPVLILKHTNYFLKKGLDKVKHQKTPYTRSFLAITADRKIIIGVTETPVTLKDLTEILMKLKCEKAINLSGGGADKLIFKDGKDKTNSVGHSFDAKEASMIAFSYK